MIGRLGSDSYKCGKGGPELWPTARRRAFVVRKLRRIGPGDRPERRALSPADYAARRRQPCRPPTPASMGLRKPKGRRGNVARLSALPTTKPSPRKSAIRWRPWPLKRASRTRVLWPPSRTNCPLAGLRPPRRSPGGDHQREKTLWQSSSKIPTCRYACGGPGHAEARKRKRCPC